MLKEVGEIIRKRAPVGGVVVRFLDREGFFFFFFFDSRHDDELWWVIRIKRVFFWGCGKREGASATEKKSDQQAQKKVERSEREGKEKKGF